MEHCCPPTNADFVIQKKIARESLRLQSVVCTSFHPQQCSGRSRDEVLFIPYFHFVFRLDSGFSGFLFCSFSVDYYFYYSDFYLSSPSQLTTHKSSAECRAPGHSRSCKISEPSRCRVIFGPTVIHRPPFILISSELGRSVFARWDWNAEELIEINYGWNVKRHSRNKSDAHMPRIENTKIELNLMLMRKARREWGKPATGSTIEKIWSYANPPRCQFKCSKHFAKHAAPWLSQINWHIAPTSYREEKWEPPLSGKKIIRLPLLWIDKCITHIVGRCCMHATNESHTLKSVCVG